MDPDLSSMRAEYAQVGMDEAAAGDDPLATFRQWLEDAVTAGVHEPNAMALATASTAGRPSVRIVLLKGLDERGAVFFSNYDSRKGRELAANPVAAAVMLWHPLQRQLRIEGPIARLPAAESDAYFASRPRGSQLGAVSSPQSAVIAGRAELEARFELMQRRFADREVDRPDDWGGYRLGFESLEFWQGRSNRMHDRLRYRRTPGGWSRERLAP